MTNVTLVAVSSSTACFCNGQLIRFSFICVSVLFTKVVDFSIGKGSTCTCSSRELSIFKVLFNVLFEVSLVGV